MVASGAAPVTPALRAHGDSFLQLQFKAKCAIHQISSTAFDARNSRLLICDNKTFSVWQLQDSRLGQGYLTYSMQTPVPPGVTQVTSLSVDAAMGAYIATGIAPEGDHMVMLLEVADGALSVKAGAPLKHKEVIECAVYNPRVHELILSTSVNESHGRLRFFSFRESVVHSEASGLDRFLLIQNRESSPGKESKGDANETDYHTVYGIGKPVDTRVRSLALDMRSNHLFGSLRRGLLVWDAETAETLFELQNLGGGDVEALAVLEGGDYVATCCAEIGEYVVSVWQLDHAGGAVACATFPSRHAIQLMTFADHGGPHLLRGQLGLYLTDAAKNFRALVLTPPGYEPGRPTPVDPSAPTPTQPLAPALGRRGYVEAIASFQNTSSLTDVVAFDARELKQGYLCTSPALARFQLSVLLVADDSVLGLSLHAPGSATTLCPFSGGVQAMSVLPDARQLTPEGEDGVVLALCHTPHTLNVVHRTSGRLLQSIALPSTGRAFQYTPSESASPSPYHLHPFNPPSSALSLPGPLPTCFKPIPLTSWVAVGYADGRVDVIDVPSGRRVQVLQPPAPVNVALTCLSWWPIGASLPQAAQSAYAMLRCPLILAGGYRDGRVVLWLLHALGSSLLTVLQAHPSPIVMAKPRYGRPPRLRFVLLTAAADGMVKAWAPAKVETSDPAVDARPESGAKEEGSLGSEWVLVGMIQPKGEGRVLRCAEVLSQGVVALGFEDGFIELWDVPSGEGREERGVHMFCHPGAAVARMQAEREKGRGKESAGGGEEGKRERLREGGVEGEEEAKEEMELAGGEASEEEGGEGEEGAEQEGVLRPESAPSGEADSGHNGEGHVEGAEGGNTGGCASCCGGPHLAVPRSPLQRFAAHHGAVACMSVRSGTPSVRLLASASTDRSVLLCTFDGRRLRVFQRCLLTHPRTLSLLSLDITPPLHPYAAPQWRVLAGAGAFVTVLRSYERPIEVKMPSFTTLTDKGKEAFALNRHTLELAPFVSPVRGTVTSTVLCPFRYRRLKPTWLPLPEEEGEEDKGVRKPGKAHRQGAKTAPPSNESTDPPPTATSPQRSPSRRRDTAGSASRPLPLRVVDVDDCCSLPETGQRSYSGPARFRTIDPAKRQAQQRPPERPAWAVTTMTETETSMDDGLISTQAKALVRQPSQHDAPPKPQVAVVERPVSVLPSRGGALHPWTPMTSQDVLGGMLDEDGSSLLPGPPMAQQTTGSLKEAIKPRRPEDSDDSDLSSNSEDESSQSAPLPASHEGRRKSSSRVVGFSPPAPLQPNSAPPSIAPRTVRRPRRRSRAEKSTVASGLHSLESNNSSLSSPVRRFVHSILRFDADKELLPTFLSQYYQHSGAAGAMDNQRVDLAAQHLLRPSKAILDILAEYRKLGRPARKPFTADTANNWNGSAHGVHVGFAVGSYDQRLSEAIDRRERELEEETRHMAKRQDAARSVKQHGKAKKKRMDLGRVGLKEEEDRMFWLDCLAEGYHAPEVARPRSNPTMMHKITDPRKARGKTPDKAGVAAVASPRVARDNDDPLMRLFKLLKGEKELLPFDQLLKWDKLMGLIASGHVNRSMLRSLLIGEDGDDGPRKNGMMLSFADFQRFVAALDLHMSWLYGPPVVQARVNAVTTTSVSLWLSVDKACSVRLGLYIHASPQTHHNPRAVAALLSDVVSGKNAVRNVGPISCERSDKSYDVALDNLQEGTMYDLFVYAEHPLGPQGRMVGLDGEALHRSKITVETETRQGEALWIEWEDLSKQQQDVELIAVSKDRAVTTGAAAANVRVPTYDDFLSSSSASVRMCREFKGWWSHSSTRGLREAFLLRELEFAVAHEPTLREGMGRDRVVLEPGDLDILKLRANQIQSQEGRLKRERSDYFRSWYKGGRVMEDLPSHVISVEERRVERLAWRTEFLSRRSARVEEAWALAQTLIDALKQEERRASTASAASNNSSDDSESRRGARGEKMRGAKAARAKELLQAMALTVGSVTTAQLSNAYLLEIFDTLHLTAKPTTPRSQQTVPHARGSVVLSPRKLAAKAANTDFMVVKEGGGAKAQETAPPPPPPDDQVGYRDMPSELGTLELRVALTLPEVMELAINDGVEVPQIEDALSLLPSRKACWHAFLDWYVSAEDVYETKWYDNPDRMRRDLSFVSGAREALLRQEGDAARRDGLVRRMLDWNSPRAAAAIMSRGFNTMESQTDSSSPEGTAAHVPSHLSVGSSQTGESSADGLSGSVSNSQSDGSSSTETDERLGMAVDKEFRKQYFNNYHVRKRFLQTQIRSMLVSRRAHALIPMAWTAFPTPVALFASLPQFMPQLPPQRPRRVILFPTADPELYSLDDIKAWYGDAELAVDDEVMREAEREQQIIAFKNLTIERERLEGIMKIWEDRRSEMMLIAEGFLSVLEAEGLAKPSRRFDHQPDMLPVEDGEGLVPGLTFPKGTGLENHDEEADAAKEEKHIQEQEEKKRALIRKQREEELKRRRDEELRKKEDERRQERIKQQEDERRSIVAHLTELKAQKAAAFELAQAKREQEEEEARIREEEETLAAVKMKHLRLQEERREQDRIALAEQQAARADKTRQARELAVMRQEDFLSSQREQTERDCNFMALDALEQLRFIYTPYNTLFADDDLEALLWDGPNNYKPRERRRHVDPYCLPSDEYHLQDMCPDKSAYACLAGEREFHRLLGTPPLHLSSRSQPRNPTPTGNTRRVLQHQTVDVMLDMVRQARNANSEVSRGLAGPCDERTHMEAQDVTGGGLRRNLAEHYHREHEERQRDAWSRGSGRRPMSSQQGPRPTSSPWQGLRIPVSPTPPAHALGKEHVEEETVEVEAGGQAGTQASEGPTPPLAVGSWQGPGGSLLSSLEGFESVAQEGFSHEHAPSRDPGDGSLTREGKELRSVAMRVHVGPPVRVPLTAGSVSTSTAPRTQPRTAPSTANTNTNPHANEAGAGRFRMFSEVKLPPPFAGPAGPMGVKGKPARLQGRKHK